MPQLRSLNIPNVTDYPGGGFEPRELAHQILDIVTLRREIRLCYVGISSKCFEILETHEKPGDSGSSASGSSTPSLNPPSGAGLSLNGASPSNVNGIPALGEEEDTTDDEGDDEDDGNQDGDGIMEEDSDEDDDDEEDEEAGEDGDAETPATAASDPDETQSDGEATVGQPGGAGGGGSANAEGAEDGDDDDDGFVEPGQGEAKLRLREILFYDDKVAIFRARHGKL